MSNHIDLRMAEHLPGQSNLQMYPNPDGTRGMVKVFDQKARQHSYAVSPPLRVKDIIFSSQYARGQTIHQVGFIHKAGQALHQMYDPTSGTVFYQPYSIKGGQGEGF